MSKNFSDGFTLIEMMIVVVVMGVLVAVGVVSYRQFNEKQEVIQAGGELTSVFRDAQKKAKSGDKPAACVAAGQILDGYKVVMYANSSQIELSAVCSGVDVLESTTSLPFDVIFDANYQMTFRVLTGGVQNAASVYIEDFNQTHTYGVEVTDFGAINDLGLQQQ